MKKAITIEDLKENAIELAKGLDSLYKNFDENKGRTQSPDKYSILLLNPDELSPDLEAEKTKFIPVNSGELLVALVKDDGSVVDLSNQS